MTTGESLEGKRDYSEEGGDTLKRILEGCPEVEICEDTFLPDLSEYED